MGQLNLSDIKYLMAKYDIRPKKKLGQNFLVDNNIIAKIVNSTDIANRVVVEIGPGLGSLTKALAQKAGRVIAVELDSRFLPPLKEVFSLQENVEIIHADALKLDYDQIMQERGLSESYVVVANLPYYITTPMIMHLLENKFNIDELVIMTQKEVANRMRAKPGTKDYGSLTLAVQYYADVSLVAKVPPTVFLPKPEVDSAVIKLKRHLKPVFEVNDEELLFKVIKAGFAKRRKTLLNALTSADLNISKAELMEICRASGINEQSRMEQLSLQEIIRLANYFKEGD